MTSQAAPQQHLKVELPDQRLESLRLELGAIPHGVQGYELIVALVTLDCSLYLQSEGVNYD